ncbi:uroporphyrinogen-III synthase [Tessaracoccus palaemonis]|uniref:Uroporphyrinogen-III synthase n=1 Tax=Tessaracoccus palaemonis TaxID=2829499 RepID=A0ABX8SG65_9ACTN|nr:uroporphyrinogen-III synthase [Tessaracoccus palaemonis]QXT62392.1 uroporphyrinogen-III synthase [Tessaracoccus palaemonis]
MTESLELTTPADEAGPDQTIGSVTFVGSGPGGLSLLTISGARALSVADLVLVDTDSDLEEVRAMIPAHSTVEAAGVGEVARIRGAVADGQRVVRLGRGDYFSDVDSSGVLAEVLATHGLRINVIPGINRWGAALSFGGVHFGNQCAVLDAMVEVPDIERWPAADTLILRTSGALAAELASVAAERLGADGETLRMVNMGSTAQVSELLTWREVSASEHSEVYFIVGLGIEDSLRDRYGWFEGKPLFDWRVVTPSTKDPLDALVEELSHYGASTEIVATMSIEPPRTEQAMEKAVRGLVDGRYLWLVFTSPYAVTAIAERLSEYGLDSRALSGIMLAAVGRGTVEALARLGLVPDLVPVVENTTGALANEFPAYDDLIDPLNRVLVPSADVSVEPLLVGLGKLGWEVEEVTAYRTVRAAPPAPEVRDDIKTGMFDAVAFTSATAVRNMIGIAGKPHAATVVAAIGPATAAACKMHGLRVDVVADQPTFESLAEGLAEFADRRRAEQVAAGLPPTKPSQRKRRKRRKVVEADA